MNTPTPEKMGNVALQQGEQLLNIIKGSFDREGGGDFNTFMKKLATVLRDPNNKLIQFGKTAFLMKRVKPDTVEVHTMSIDNPQGIVQAFQGAAKFLKSQGMKKAVSYADSPAYVKLAKQTGLPVRVGQSAKVMKGQAKPVYTFELDL
jgi:hypothetical protein